MFPLLSLARASHHFIHLKVGARADLRWWRVFLWDWNGSSFFPATTPSLNITSDASGTYGCGAFSLPHGWFQVKWPESWGRVHITAKELVPTVIAAALWGQNWRRIVVCFRSDNMAVVNLLKCHTLKDQLLMHLLRCLAFYAAFYGFEFVAEHMAGVNNTAADAISCNNIPLFVSLCPQTPQVTVSQVVLDLLVIRRPNWGSHDWTKLFAHSLIGGISEATRAVYQSGWRQYPMFCTRFNLPSPLSLTEQSLRQFAAFLSESGFTRSVQACQTRHYPRFQDFRTS